MSGTFVHKIIIAGCTRLAGPYHPAAPEDTMNPDDHPAPPPPTPSGPSRRVTAFAVVTVALTLVVAVAVVLTIRGDGDAAGSSPSQPPPPQPSAAATTTTLDPKTEVVARLREILRVRDRAFHDRDAELLPRRNLDSGLTGGRLRRSGTVRTSSYFRTF
jgi:hypothetical protein